MKKPDEPEREKITSVEAAAMLISDGHTKDPELASIMANEKTFDMDGMQKAHLRRMMGFDFKVKIQPSRILITTKEGKLMRARCAVLPGELDAHGNIIAAELIDRLVEACLRLKVRWDKAQKDES